jgi:hypothetical protein
MGGDASATVAELSPVVGERCWNVPEVSAKARELAALAGEQS